MAVAKSRILFEFDSVVDTELTAIREIRAVGKSIVTKDVNLDSFIFKLSDTELKKYRMFSSEDIIYQILKEDAKDTYLTFPNMVLDMVDCTPFLQPTAMHSLIKAFAVVGGGILKADIRCNNHIQANLINSLFNRTNRPNIIICGRDEIDTNKYGTYVFGFIKDALEYDFETPKNIRILNFRTNFDKDHSDILKPEYAMPLTDIHTLEIVDAYREEDLKPNKESEDKTS